MEQDIAAQVVGLGGATDFTLWSLFMRADFVVKFVIILLIASSIFSWALIFDKFKLFKNINKSTEDFEKKFYISCDDWFNSPVYRIIWYSMGNNEFISIDSYLQKHKSCYSCARYCRSSFCNSVRFASSDTSSYCL